MSEENIYTDYFKLTKEYQETYGKKTVVLMQVGAFFEVYGIKHDDGVYTESQIQDFCDVCQLNFADKKNCFINRGTSNMKQIAMAGFMVYLLDKYLSKMMESGYTAVVYVQEKDSNKNNKPFNRVLEKIYSPGTFISCETDSSPQITNNIMSIWFYLSKQSGNIKNKELLICGISVVNIFTGKSYIFEYQTQFILNNTTFDELERAISVFNPSEILFISPFEEKDIIKIVQYTNIQSLSIHYFNLNNKENKKIVNCENQKYIKQILTVFYNEETYNICSEFNNNIIATQSFCFLLNFIQEHNPDLIRKIDLPIFNNTSTRMILANHTLMQLNIINEGSQNKMGKYSSVLNFVNKCCSAIGKRKLEFQLTNPTSEQLWLNKEYELTKEMLKSENYDYIDNIRKNLMQVRDIEKIIRQIISKKIYPSSIAHLHKTIEIVFEINELFQKDNISTYLCDEFQNIEKNDCNSIYVKKTCNNILSFLNNTFYIDICKKTSSMTSFDENIIKPGISESLDSAIMEYEKSIRIFHGIKDTLNKLIWKNDASAAQSKTEFIRIHETERSGNSLQITSKRSQTLKTILDGLVSKNINIEGTIIDLSQLKFSKVSSSSQNMNIDHSIIDKICDNMLHSKEKINGIITKTYLDILTTIDNQWNNDLENISKYIGKIDVLQCKAYLAKNYNYCCPEIKDNQDKSYVSVNGLRHCLIEHIQQNEIYVTNDISLGLNNESGILLYGTNAVGKTSLIRALGIAVIMAQSGMFVPCSQFVYKPYTAIYSRILGNDNIFKGLSTFAVEMSELRIILKMSDKNSLILGDELCSGTETESALSIFVAGLIKLCEKNTSFIFATHFHEITQYDEILERKEILMKHMSVIYNRENDCLVYDRKLKEGSGPKIYGLEVCKSIYLDEDFLNLAYDIRNKYYPECRGELSNNTTTYNANKIRGLCEICKIKMGTEIHHLNPQKNADERGFIDTFHKNHTGNLISICEDCHNKTHKEEINNEKTKKKTTMGYKII
jgi:DNA mismatch repair protein MutS